MVGKLSLITIALCLAGALTCNAQLTGSGISGTVTDPRGAVIPKAKISVINGGTGIIRTGSSNDDGFYNVPDLVPGNYDITITAGGFSATSHKGIVLTVGDQLILNVQLPVGSDSQVVTVTSQTPTVELASSTVSAAVAGQTIRDLPLNGRDWIQLATLEPGVSPVSTQNALATGSNSRLNSGLGNQIIVSGNRPQQNNYRVDGISINDFSGGGPGNVLGGNTGVDAIQEFSVVTSNASAEYAKTSGGVFNAMTRAGTDTFHGSLYEFLRNSALDARNYFDHSIPPLRRNQFGGSIGGPIVKQRTFFFLDYEGLRQSLGTTNLITVPSPAARTGHLSNGQIISVDPKVVPYFALFPVPNLGVAGDTGTYSFVGKTATTEDFIDTRIDHHFSDKDSLHGTYWNDNSSSTGPDAFNTLLTSLISRRRLLALEELHVFSPNLVNSARVGFSRVIGQGPVPIRALNPIANDTTLGFVPGKPMGLLNISGLSSYTGGYFGQAEDSFHYNSFQGYDDVIDTKGTHALKAGVAFERIQANQLSTGDTADGNYTFGPLAAFLQNQPTSFLSLIPGQVTPIDLRQDVVGTYFQDDWRVRPSLTVNAGFRYEMVTVPTEAHNRLSTLVNLTDAAPKLGSPYFNNPTKLNLSPRVGFSWDPFGNGRTALRGGFGIYDTLPLTYQFETLSLLTAPFQKQGQVTSLPLGSFPVEAFPLLGPANNRISAVQQDPKRSYLEQWNVDVQRQFGTTTLQVGYMGSRAFHQPFRSQNTNLVMPTQTTQGLLWPSTPGTRINSHFGAINTLRWQANAYYDALQVKLSRDGRWDHLGASYTFAKDIDDNSASLTGGQFTNSVNSLIPFFPKYWRSLSDFDVRHNVVVSYLLRLPEPHATKFAADLAKGWQLNGIVRASSGVPFTVSVGGDPLGMGLGGNSFDFPNRLAGNGCKSAVNPGNSQHYIKAECFAAPAPTTLMGNGGRNGEIGPGIVNLDASLFKSTNVPKWEGSKIEFRAETFNVANHSNFNPPSGSQAQVFNQKFQPIPSVGQLTSTSTTSRQIQVGLKLLF